MSPKDEVIKYFDQYPFIWYVFAILIRFNKQRIENITILQKLKVEPNKDTDLKDELKTKVQNHDKTNVDAIETDK